MIDNQLNERLKRSREIAKSQQETTWFLLKKTVELYSKKEVEHGTNR